MNQRYHLRELALIVFIVCSTHTLAAPLGKVLEQVLQQHPDVRSSQALIDVSQEAVVQARSGFFPILGLTGQASNGRDEQSGVPLDRDIRRIDASLRWNVFRGLSDKHGLQAARHENLAAIADLGEAHERVSQEVTLAYLEVMRQRCLVQLSQSFVADQTRLAEEINRRVRAGRIPVADASQAKNSLIQSQRLATQAQSQLVAAEHRFKLITGQPAEAMSMPAFALLDENQTMGSLLDKVVAGNHRLKAVRERIIARTEEIGVAAGALYPSIDLELRKRISSEIDPPTLTDTIENKAFQLNYQMPLGGATFSRKREAEYRRVGALAEADAILLRLQSELSQSWALWRETVDLKKKYAERAEATDVVVAAYDLQFDAGRRSLLDLVSVRAERFQARADLAESRIQELAANARMLSVLGELKHAVLQGGAAPPDSESGCQVNSDIARSQMPAPLPVAATPVQDKANRQRDSIFMSMPMSGECNSPFFSTCIAGQKPVLPKRALNMSDAPIEMMRLSEQTSAR